MSGGKIAHIGISVYCAKTCLSCLQYYEQMEGELEGEERAAYKEISSKLKAIKKKKVNKQRRQGKKVTNAYDMNV